MVHPFHPLHGREFEHLGHPRNANEERVRFCDDNGLFRDMPLTWTNAAPEDPFLEMAQGRSWFRWDDLMELIGIIEEWKR